MPRSGAGEVQKVGKAQEAVQLRFGSACQLEFSDIKHIYLQLQLTELLLKDDFMEGSMSATVRTVFDFVLGSSFLSRQDYDSNTTAQALSFYPPLCVSEDAS